MLNKFNNLNKYLSCLDAKTKRDLIFIFILIVFGTIIELISLGAIIPIMIFLLEDDIPNFLEKFDIHIPIINQLSQFEIISCGLGILILIYFIKSIYIAFLRYYSISFTNQAYRSISKRLYSSYLKQPYNFHLQRNSSQLIKNIEVESSIFAGNLMVAFLTLITDVFILIGIFVLLLNVETLGTTGIFLFLIFLASLFYLFLRKKLTQWGNDRQLLEISRHRELRQGFGAVKEIILRGLENNFLKRFEKKNYKLTKINEYETFFKQLPQIIIEFLAIVSFSFLILVMLYNQSDTTKIIYIVGLFSVAAFKLLPVFNRILISLQTIRFFVPSIDVVYNQLRFEKNLYSSANTKTSNLKEKIFLNSIKINNITFKYENSNKQVIKNATVEINKNDFIGIFGDSGSGKSTFVDIIMGLSKPTEGNIQIDTKNIEDVLRQWQLNIGYVPQSVYLADDTIKNNIALGINENEIDEKLLNQAIKNSQLDTFIKELPQGVNTYIGEHGSRISGGQRQRMGIARALYNNPYILIFDEATSALDIDTENEILKSIKLLFGKKTIIVISHRINTLSECKKIYKISAGQIILSNLKDMDK